MAPVFTTARIVWTSMLAALPLYAVVLLVLVSDPGPASTANVVLLRSVFLVLSLAVAGVIVFFRRRLPSPSADPARSPAVDPAANLTAYVVGWALAESIALYGLVLAFLSRDAGEAVPFFVASALLLLWQRPRREHFVAAPGGNPTGRSI
jgi:hypothetical protein